MKARLLRWWGALPIPVPVRWWLVRRYVSAFPVGVVGVITNEQRQILLFRHTYRGRYPWGLPGGWLERGEHPDAAIRREIMEETGLVVACDRLLLAWNDPHFGRLDLFYVCRIVSGDFHPSDEVQAIGWFSEQKLPAMLRSQYDMIARIFGMLSNWRDDA